MLYHDLYLNIIHIFANFYDYLYLGILVDFIAFFSKILDLNFLVDYKNKNNPLFDKADLVTQNQDKLIVLKHFMQHSKMKNQANGNYFDPNWLQFTAPRYFDNQRNCFKQLN